MCMTLYYRQGVHAGLSGRAWRTDQTLPDFCQDDRLTDYQAGFVAAFFSDDPESELLVPCTTAPPEREEAHG